MCGSFPSQIWRFMISTIHFVEIDLESMFQRSLYDYIYKLQFIGTVCKNKPKKVVKIFFLSNQEIHYSCECSTN
jgi:hypothetical protein